MKNIISEVSHSGRLNVKRFLAEMVIMARFKNLTGQKFGKLIAVKYLGKRKWLCVCECGKEKIKYNNGFTAISSCGCGRKRLPKGQPGLNWLIYRYKRQARQRSLPWELSNEQVQTLTSRPCYYCGVQPKQQSNDYTYNGIDRLNNNLGYAIKNCVACCGQCNYAKRDLSVSEFTEWVLSIFYHHIADRN